MHKLFDCTLFTVIFLSIMALAIPVGCSESEQPLTQPVEILNPNITADLDGVVTVDKVTNTVKVDVNKPDVEIHVEGYQIWADRGKNAKLVADFREENRIPPDEPVQLKQLYYGWNVFGKITNNSDTAYTPKEWYLIVDGVELNTSRQTIPKNIQPNWTVPFWFSTDSFLHDRLDDSLLFEVILKAPWITGE